EGFFVFVSESTLVCALAIDRGWLIKQSWKRLSRLWKAYACRSPNSHFLTSFFSTAFLSNRPNADA
ncbi:MAG: hypothetical protein ABI212_06260, partial [Burkholderiaceae bacterium]